MADSRPTGGIIVAVYPGTGPVSPSAITYDVEWTWEDGSKGGASGVSSAQQQGNVNVWPARVGTTCPIVWLNDEPYFHIYQPPYFYECVTPEAP